MILHKAVKFNFSEWYQQILWIMRDDKKSTAEYTWHDIAMLWMVGATYGVLGTMIGQNEYVIRIAADQGQVFCIAVLVLLWRGWRSTEQLTQTWISKLIGRNGITICCVLYSLLLLFQGTNFVLNWSPARILSGLSTQQLTGWRVNVGTPRNPTNTVSTMLPGSRIKR